MPVQKLEFQAGFTGSDVVPELEKIAAGLTGQATATVKVISATERYNTLTDRTMVRIKSEISANQTLVTSIRSVSDARLKALQAEAAARGKTVTQIGDPAKNLVASSRIITTQTPGPSPSNVAAGISASEKARAAFPAPTNATLAQLAKYEAALAKIQSIMSGRPAGAQRFQDLMDAARTKDFSKLGPLSDDDQKLLSTLGQIETKFNKTAAAAKSFGLTLKSAFNIAEATLFYRAIGLITDKFSQGVKNASDYQIKIAEIRTLATQNQSSFESWSQSIANVSDMMGIEQIEVAKTAYAALSAQVVDTRGEVVEFTKAAGNLSRVGVASMSEAGEVLQTVVNAYGKSVGSLEEISAKLFISVDRGNFTLGQLHAHMGRILGPARAIGVTFDELMASLITISKTSNPADAVTQLSNVILKLQAPGEDMKKFLSDTFGTESAQAAIQMKGLLGVLEEFRDNVDGDTTAIAKYARELRAMRGFTSLTQGPQGQSLAGNLKALQDNPLAKLEEAIELRGEPAADKLKKQFTKIDNYFTNEFGQGFLKSLAQYTGNLSVAGYMIEFGDLFNVVKKTTELLVSGAKIFATYYIATKTSSLATGLLTKSMEALGVSLIKTEKETAKVGDTTKKTAGEMSRAGKAAALLQGGLNFATAVVTVAQLYREVQKYRAEMDGAVQKSEEFSNVLDRINKSQRGLNVKGDRTESEIFEADRKKEAKDFGNAVDTVMKSRMEEGSIQVRKLAEGLKKLKEEGVEAATQLTIAFKGTTDSIAKTINAYTKALGDANRAVDELKNNILGIQDTLGSLTLELKMNFADEGQKQRLRREEIERLNAEQEKLFKSNDAEDINRARQTQDKMMRLIAELGRAEGEAQNAREKARRTAMGTGEGSQFPDNSPIRPNLDATYQELEEASRRREENERNYAARAKGEIPVLETKIAKERERERLLTKRIQDITKLSLFDESGKVKTEFLDKSGNVDMEKYKKTIGDQAKLITDQLTSQEEKTKVMIALRELENNLIKQGTQELGLRNTEKKQSQDAQAAEKMRGDYAAATEDRIAASKELEQVNKEFQAGRDLGRLFPEKAKEAASYKTMAKEADLATYGAIHASEAMFDIGKGIQELGLWANNLTDKAVGKPGFKSTLPEGLTRERQIAKDPATLALLAQIDQSEQALAAATAKLVGRDAKTGLLTGKEEDVGSLRAARTKLFLDMDLLIQKLKPGLSPEERLDFRPTPESANMRGIREDNEKLVERMIKLFQKESGATKEQERLKQALDQSLTPLEQETRATRGILKTNSDMTVLNTNMTQLLTEELRKAPKIKEATPQPANIYQPTQAFVPGKHFGGLLTGPAGYDNLLIRAEAGEFIMSQAATKKWLPQLIAMNSGRSPKNPGQYHEGGLVQTNVGDVNVTISGPVSPEKNVRQIGNALRRSIRRGNLDLTSKR